MAKKKEELKEFSLDSLLANMDEIGKKKEDKEVTIEHKRLNSTFTFLTLNLSDLTSTVSKDGKTNLDAVYEAVSLSLITKIDDDMLKALKVENQLGAVKKIFDEDEITIVFASLVEHLEDNGITIKKK